MTDVLGLLLAILPLCPLLAALLTIGLRYWRPESRCHGPAVIAGSLVFITAVGLVVALNDPQWTPRSALQVPLYRWAAVTDTVPLTVTLALRIDSLSSLLLAVSAGATLLIIWSAAAWSHQGIDRHGLFAGLSFVQFATIMLLLSAGFVQLMFFWILSAAAAALLTVSSRAEETAGEPAVRMLLVGRIADVGLWGAAFLIWVGFGTFEFLELFSDTRIAGVSAANPFLITGVCLCLLAAVIGRCAQFPVFGWLHQTATAPSAVGATLHASATMPAGVYLIARCTPLFEVAPGAQSTMAFVGGFTALLTAAVAVTQSDLKRVLAYVSAGQFGLMLLGLGTGAAAGVAAALFLLIVHVLTFSLLYLAAENVLQQSGGVAEFSALGGLRKAVPWAYAGFLVGGLVVSVGLWGQDGIVAAVWEAAHRQPAEQQPLSSGAANQPVLGADSRRTYLGLTWMAIIALALTAFALFRAIFLTFHHDSSGSRRQAELAMPAIERATPGRWLPLVVLAVAAPATGLLLLDPLRSFAGFLDRTIPGVATQVLAHRPIVGPTTTAVLLGIVAAWMMYAHPTDLPARVAAALGAFTRLSQNRFYLDRIFHLAIVLPLRATACLLRLFDDSIADGAFVRLAGWIPRQVGRLVQPVQNGLVQFYALSMMLATAVWILVLLWLHEN
jgi:NADH:ubiquinone oxidoreductase subunit 5 (subunit L)/multisubunit Na+/H+ antiporter MnhA subunit